MKSKDKLFSAKSTLNLRGNLFSLDTPRIMGILNVTPDSFYTGSRTVSEQLLVDRAGQMLNEGASFLDIGGYSTRPDAEDISVSMELDRVLQAIELISTQFKEAYISIDTFRAEVARKAVSTGACLVNDVSGGNLDRDMFQTVADLGVPYVLMHMRGTPKTMKSLSSYKHLLNDITSELSAKCDRLKSLGVADIIIDPGFGFAKTIEQNYDILRNLGYFKRLNLPILAGISRKSMIYKTLNATAEEALNGTTALNMAALMNGASILRVHDVKEAKETVTLYEAYKC